MISHRKELYVNLIEVLYTHVKKSQPYTNEILGLNVLK